jgi:hypothetical protein
VSKKAPSQATALVELAQDVEFFCTPKQEAYAALESGGHREIWSLRTKPFKTWLARRYFHEYGGAPGAQALQDALAVLEGKAIFEDFVHDVYVRIAEFGDATFIDLTDDAWQAIRVDRSGWEIVAEPPVRFRRAPGMRELVPPVAGGRLEALRPFLNVTDEDWPLLVGWLLAAGRARGPYPVLALHGEQGTAKSTTARVLRELIDPNEVDVRAHPRDDRDVVIAARNGHVLAFDNLSHLPQWLSDAFCRLSTGGGFATRSLYTDSDEVLFNVIRPLILNGISEVATSGDLLDRSLITYLPRIPERRRQTEREFWAEFEPLRGQLLGALLDAVVVGLRRIDEIELERKPRMADFAEWVVACEPGLGWPAGSFLDAYESNRSSANELTLEASPLSQPLRSIAEVGFSGTAGELLQRLADYADEEQRRQRGWPKSASALSGRLRRLAPNLRAVGVEVEFQQTGGRGSRRLVVIRMGTENADAADAADANGVVEPNRASASDGDGVAGVAGVGDLHTQSSE